MPLQPLVHTHSLGLLVQFQCSFLVFISSFFERETMFVAIADIPPANLFLPVDRAAWYGQDGQTSGIPIAAEGIKTGGAARNYGAASKIFI